MAVNNLKKKFVGDDQIDGSKILLEQGQSIKAKDSLGVEQDLIKLGPSDEVLVGPLEVEVAVKGDSVQKSGDVMTGELSVNSDGPSFTAKRSDPVSQPQYAQISSGDISIRESVAASSKYATMSPNYLEVADPTAVSGNYTIVEGGKITLQNWDSSLPVLPVNPEDVTVKKYVDDEIAAESSALQLNIDAVADDVSHLVTLSGVAVDSDNLGTFTGTTIADSQNIKQALQALESAVEAVSGGGSSTQDELDDTQLGAGLEVDGSYLAPAVSNYLSAATSLKDADSKLDAQIKTVADGLAQELIDRANADSDLQDAIDAVEVGAGLEIDGSYLADVTTNYIPAATSLKNADFLLDLNLKIARDDIADLESEDLLFLKLDGTRPMEANLNMMNNLVHNKIVGLADPTDARDAVNKQYVDAVAQGLHVHAPAKALFAASLASVSGGSVTYDNGTSGEGATLSLANPVTAIDGYTLQIGDRVIINGESNQAHNGIYLYSSSTLFTRASDFDSTIEAAGGDFIFVQEGNSYGDSGWVMTETTSAIGTSPIIFVQFSGAGQLSEGDAIDLVGNEINVLYDNSSIGVNGSNQLFVKTDGISNAMLQDDSVDKSNIASDVAGIGLQQAVDGSLEIKLDGSSLSVSASGLKSNIIWSKAYFDLTSTDITNGYVEFPTGVIAEAGSIIGFVDRLAIHEDEDFTVSTVSGKTRITFAGDLINPGQSALDANDNLYFKFQKKAI